jgi:hypothetical protein
MSERNQPQLKSQDAAPQRREAEAGPQTESADMALLAGARAGGRGGPPDGHSTRRALRQSQLLHSQQQRGNQVVRRQLQGGGSARLQRDPTDQTATLGGRTYVVRPGDTLWGIAQQTYGDGHYWQEIYRANPGHVGAGGNLILVDSELTLPALAVPVASAEPASSGAAEPPMIGPPPPPMIGPPPPPPAASSAASPPAPASSSSSAPVSSAPASSSASPQTADAGQSASASDYLGGVARSCVWPAFRYNLPTIPLSTVIEVIPGGTLTYTLGWRGNVTVQREGRCLPWSVDQSGVRLEANEVVGQFTSGVRVNSVGSDAMSLGVTFAGNMSSSEVRYIPPTTMVFISQERAVSFSYSGYQLTGDVGWEMRVEYTPDLLQSASSVAVAAPAPSRAVNWEEVFAVVGGAVLLVGAVALIVGTLVEDVGTGGAGVADDPISFAAAAEMMRQGARMAF